jgi:hypothetical protein
MQIPECFSDSPVSNAIDTLYNVEQIGSNYYSEDSVNVMKLPDWYIIKWIQI